MHRLAAILALLGLLALGSGAAGYAHELEHLSEGFRRGHDPAAAADAGHHHAPGSGSEPEPDSGHADCAACALVHAPATGTLTAWLTAFDRPLAGAIVLPAAWFHPWRHVPTFDGRGPPPDAIHA